MREVFAVPCGRCAVRPKPAQHVLHLIAKSFDNLFVERARRHDRPEACTVTAATSPRMMRTLRQTSRLCAFVAATLAMLALVGWVVDNALLRGLLPQRTPMNPVTAVAILLSGIVLWIIEDSA